MFYPCNRYRPRRLKYRRLNEAGTDGRADKAGSQKSWAELTDGFRLEQNQLLSCYLAWNQPNFGFRSHNISCFNLNQPRTFTFSLPYNFDFMSEKPTLTRQNKNWQNRKKGLQIISDTSTNEQIHQSYCLLSIYSAGFAKKPPFLFIQPDMCVSNTCTHANHGTNTLYQQNPANITVAVFFWYGTEIKIKIPFLVLWPHFSCFLCWILRDNPWGSKPIVSV